MAVHTTLSVSTHDRDEHLAWPQSLVAAFYADTVAAAAIYYAAAAALVPTQPVSSRCAGNGTGSVSERT